MTSPPPVLEPAPIPEPAAAAPAASAAAAGTVTRHRGRRELLPAAAIVAGLHVLGWGTLLLVIVPQALTMGRGSGSPVVFGVGIGFAAYALGMRHAFDADHIAAIDNTTRRLLDNGRPASTVGLWFSLGHSSVVVALCVLVAAGVKSIGTLVADDSSALHQVTGIIGPGVSGTFLLIIGVLNLRAVIGLVRVARRAGGAPEEHAHDVAAHLRRRGLVSRIVFRANRSIRSPRQMFGVGLLFGLGFDTATEIGLLVLAGTATASALPWYAILTLPLLFAAGMSLLDTTQGLIMCRAYGWAEKRPSRALTYNIAVTSVSVAAALVIGTVELCGVVASEFPVGDLVSRVGSTDLGALGFVLTGVVLTLWAGVAVAHALSRSRSPVVSPVSPAPATPG